MVSKSQIPYYGAPAQGVNRFMQIWGLSLAIMKMKVLSDGPLRGHGRITSWVLVFIRKSDVEKDNTVHSQDVVKKSEGNKTKEDGSMFRKLGKWIVRQSEVFTDYKVLEIVILTVAGLCLIQAIWQGSFLHIVNPSEAKLFLAEGLLWHCLFFYHADFQTICEVQVHVIDINDQIPIFEKSDVSIFNTVFDVPNKLLTNVWACTQCLQKSMEN